MHKYIFLYVLILSLHYSQSSVEDEVKELIKKIQNAIPEPINFSEINISVPDNKYISGVLNLSSCNVTGLKAFDLKINFYPFGIVPYGLNFYLKSFEIDTDYVMNMPLLNMKWLALFGLGNFHLSLSDLSMNASVSIDLQNPLNKLKINLGGAQLGITGFLDDPDYNNELSEELSESIPLIVNSEGFSSLVEKTLNGIVASIFKKKNDTTVSVPEIDSAAERGLFVVDILNALRIWVEDSFEYANTQET
ncbi:uncharacterized protein isoform X2 [Leptinotarsa decemlineata]|uniref:uncharacterized protein isoform X2 n=1 Tax=Leptinotarsa decemlineata TaxID=7539 RepID=UPI003D309194